MLWKYTQIPLILLFPHCKRLLAFLGGLHMNWLSFSKVIDSLMTVVKVWRGNTKLIFLSVEIIQFSSFSFAPNVVKDLLNYRIIASSSPSPFEAHGRSAMQTVCFLAASKFIVIKNQESCLEIQYWKQIILDDGVEHFLKKTTYVVTILGHFQLVNIYKGCYRSHDLL